MIRSILDTDLYKLTMQKAVLGYCPGVPVRYVFNNRRPEGKFNAEFAERLREEIGYMSTIGLSDDEADFLRKWCPFLDETYIQYLKNYRFNPAEVKFSVKNSELLLEVVGPWERTILWEVPLMALISQLFFEYCDKNWTFDGQEKKIDSKTERLEHCWAKYTDFGTRRRRSYLTQNIVVGRMVGRKGFQGTSNVHLAHKYGVRPIGTMAHEWIMGVSALEGLRHANRHAMRIWSDVFKGNLGTALTDTYGTDAFFADFDGYMARLFDGVRHDSGDPNTFVEKTLAAYKKLRIDPLTKTVIFSDGLTVEAASTLSQRWGRFIRVAFGIGTHFTNDFDGSPALNMVIKMAECNRVPVVKLSDTPSKAIGDVDALRVAKWTFFGTPLDA